ASKWRSTESVLSRPTMTAKSKAVVAIGPSFGGGRHDQVGEQIRYLVGQHVAGAGHGGGDPPPEPGWRQQVAAADHDRCRYRHGPEAGPEIHGLHSVQKPT